jgi:hypothetical protein
VDRLDRRIDVALFERKSAEYRQQQARISPRSKDRRGQRAVHGSWHQPISNSRETAPGCAEKQQAAEKWLK